MTEAEPKLMTIREHVDGSTIVASALASMEAALRAIIATFAEQRTAWRDGYTVWMGWGPLALAATDDGYVVTSPDYTADPNVDVTNDLSSSMWVLFGQSLVVREAKVEPVDAAFNQDLIASNDWHESRMLTLSRIEPKDQDSGWFIQPFPPRTEGGWEPHELERIQLWSAVQRREAVARVLALPPGVSAVIDGDGVRTVFRDADQVVLAANV